MKIIYTTTDSDQINVVTYATLDQINESRKLLGQPKLASKDYMAHVMAKSLPADVETVIEVEDSEIPADRTFRNAWSIKNKKVDVDMDSAKKLHMDTLRAIRNKQLQSLDVEIVKAIETDDTAAKQAVIALKQKLRDMPETEDLSKIKTPEDLKKHNPDYLDGNPYEE